MAIERPDYGEPPKGRLALIDPAKYELIQRIPNVPRITWFAGWLTASNPDFIQVQLNSPEIDG